MGTYTAAISSLYNLGTAAASNVYYARIDNQTACGSIIYQTWVVGGTVGTNTISGTNNYTTIPITNFWPNFDFNLQTAMQTISTPARALSSEELAKIQEQVEEDRKRREAAKQRARQLLCSLLNDRQKEQLEKENAFELKVSGRIYRIRPGRKVERLKPDSKAAEVLFCIHPDSSHELPEEDVALSQKLLLEADEAAFLKTANQWAA